MIQDSGNRTGFATGAVRDIQENKGRCDLLPLLDVACVIQHDHDIVSDQDLDEKRRYYEHHSSRILRQLDGSIETFKDDDDARSFYNDLSVIIYDFITYVLGENASLFMLEVSIHFKEGAEKYGEYNWQKGIPYHSYIDSAVRHFLKVMAGMTDERHDRAFVWNLLCLMWTIRHKPEMNDIYWTDAK